jgi:hypothetical protein
MITNSSKIIYTTSNARRYHKESRNLGSLSLEIEMGRLTKSKEQGDPQDEYFDENAYEFENEDNISLEADVKIIDNQELQYIINEDPGVDDEAHAN